MPLTRWVLPCFMQITCYISMIVQLLSYVNGLELDSHQDLVSSCYHIIIQSQTEILPIPVNYLSFTS